MAKTNNVASLTAQSREPDNKSGFAPFDTRVLVLPDQVADKIGSFYMPESKKERDAWAMTKATLIAVGSNAFIDWGDDADKPAPGDRVVIAQYAGKQHEGDDGLQYRICKDEDILAAHNGGQK